MINELPERGPGQIQIKGILSEEGWEKRYESIRRIYGTEGIAPTIPQVKEEEL